MSDDGESIRRRTQQLRRSSLRKWKQAKIVFAIYCYVLCIDLNVVETKR